MSVLRHGGAGGGFLQRRLTKLYTDTKTSCESVTTASKAIDDPELVALHQSFQKQRDRLLAWGLDWSDASAAQPNDIDESLTAAGFSDVVESVMSSIQDLLNEAERVQHIDPPLLPSKERKVDLPSKDTLGTRPLKTQWTERDISRSKTILSDLTACIDTLYDLSSSRRTMASSMSSNKHSGSASTRRPRPNAVSLYDASHGSFSGSKEKVQSPKSLYDPFTYSPSASQRDYNNPFVPTSSLVIERSALQLYGTAHDNCPPPYEPIAASSNSRAVGRLKTSASPYLLSSIKDSHVSVLVEFMPVMVNSQMDSNSSRLEKLQHSLDQLLQNARIAHLGLLRFIGYTLDEPNARYAFLYQMPVDYFPFLRNPSDLLKELKPVPLVAMLPSAEDYREKRMPNLETRFRLAYDLLMSALHLRSQNAVHGNINSSNVIFFPGRTDANNDDSGLAPDMRRPYLTSPARYSCDGPTPEPVSSAMYRHPEDKRSLEDDAAWAYDLYSLGLVLLEIGLWAPVKQLWKMKYDRSWFKHRVEDLYVKKLAPKCGNGYMQAVQLCLDAPNFHLSTQPMTDLGLRVPQIYHYPVLDLSDPDGIFSFSMNFLYTISKILWSCCRIDIFGAPPAEELDDCLPLALVPTPEPTHAPAQPSAWMPTREPANLDKQLPTIPACEWSAMAEERNMDKPAKKRTVKRLPHLEIPDEHLQEWNFQMMPRLSRLLQKILKESNESCGATLMMTGESAETARTTICVTCASVKKVRQALKKHFPLGRDDWDLIVLRGDIERSKVPRKKKRRPAKTRPNGSNEIPFRQRELNPCYQQQPLCGASIGAFQNEEHLPPVSYGGAVLVDGQPYGLTVHHMLEAPSDDEGQGDDEPEAPSRSAGTWPGDPSSVAAHHDLNYTYADDEPSFEFEISDGEDGDDASLSLGGDGGDDEYWLSDDDSSDDESIDGGFDDDDDAASIGDTAGIEPGEEPRLLVTQPAIDDVHDDFFPTPEDRDDEHLASHSLGYVHASSGVRRWTRKGIKHEIDWALIKVDEARMDPRNIIMENNPPLLLRPGMPPPPPIFLSQVARMEELGGLSVHCRGRTSGLQTGQISKAMTLVKLHGRHSFSTSFCVNGNFGAPGDSGAWVFDRSTGRVCGHVLAWSARSNTTYISPMEVTLDDIARTLGASLVSLPGEPPRSMGYADPNQHPQHCYPQHQQLPGDFNRLAVGGVPGHHMPPHPFTQPYPQHPGFGRPPPPPPPPPPRPGSHEPHVFRNVSPIPPSLLTGPRNIERQLA
ncbi:hypothetical protein N7532_003602 [Penicillium argentinense]|uniref:Protein kinase domain-containing protein n=1 Tax=Penicillium argentinense TaxID=1131581 RepID=A0A9W9FMS3_9EURO|nr:uncharacterized protein N7532_003602 [Penicillium argentinense]KAJ5103073.1 hypothetical protein N7532_003602 [Penicillium argentinense]